VTGGPVRRDCARCSHHGFPAASFPDGHLCRPCLRAALDTRGPCPGCGTDRALPGKGPGGVPACRDCAGITRHFTCLHCDWEGNLADSRLCIPCAVPWTAARLLDDGTGRVAPALAPLAAALAAAPSPAATLQWLKTPHIRLLLTGLAAGRIPLTRQALADRPDWRSSIHLADLLTDCGVLPPADRQLAGYEAWARRRLAALAAHPGERLLRQFSLWHQLPAMRARAAAGPLRPGARKYAEQRFTQAQHFLDWAGRAGRPLRRLTQADIDTWHAAAPAHARQGARSFLSWAMTARHMPALALPAIRYGPGEAITQDRRLDLLRRYVTSDAAPARIRAAACLMLLYAQPLTRLLLLTTADITRGTAGEILLHLGDPPAPVPDPFAGLLLQVADSRPASTSPWLFPGRSPGQPAAYRTFLLQLRDLGFPMRAARISALRQLVLQAPAPVIADALGFHPTTTHRQHHHAGGTWARYPGRDHAR
jgi:hypothetical protein